MSDIIRMMQGERDPLILSEMIGLVDKKKMQIAMSGAVSFLSKKKTEVSMDIVNEYIKRWADAKYEFYLNFDRKLTISEEIEFDMSESEMIAKINDLCKQYPQYALLLKSIRTTDYISNKFTNFNTSGKDEEEKFVIDMYKQLYFTKDKKISTALCELIKDKGHKVSRTLGDGSVVEALHTFDIELSKILQTKKLKGKIAISIDPLDYLMMSTNKHNWISCMALAPTCQGHNNTVLSKMLDESAVVAYKCSDEIYEYDIKGFKWEHISMQARYLIYNDKMTSGFSIDYGQGGQNKTEALQLEFVKLYKKQLVKHFDVKDAWTNISSQYPSDRLSYHEEIRTSYVHTETYKKYKRPVYFDIGVKEIICPNCGKRVTEKGNFICCV